MERFLDELREVAAEMENSPHVDLRKSRLDQDAAPDWLLDKRVAEIADDTGFELNDELVECINASNGTKLWWFYQIDDQPKGAGEFYLRHLWEVFTYGPPELWTEETPADEADFLKKLHVIDQRPNSGDNKFAAFKLEEGQMPPELWYYDRGDCSKMDITYPGYIEALLDLKGITDWQYLFCEVDLHDALRRGLDDKLEQRLEDLETLFPDRDYQPYHARLAAMRSSP